MSNPMARQLAFVLVAAMLACAPTASSAETCSQPQSDGSEPVVRDCIHIARASIDAVSCRDCVCDTNGSGEVSIADALRCLWFVIGVDVTLACPACESTTTTTTAETCASCSDVFFHAAGPDELCEASQILHDAMIDCPCNECDADCAGYCDDVPETIASRECARCVFDVCRDDIAACLED